MSALHTLLHFTWCLPQTLLGLILRGFGHNEILTVDSTKLVGVTWLKDSLFSLGRHIFYPANSEWVILTEHTVRHEQGHSRQSLILGWLYLPVIAIPSLAWHIWYYHNTPKCSYYDFYTERWANRLMGITP